MLINSSEQMSNIAWNPWISHIDAEIRMRSSWI